MNKILKKYRDRLNDLSRRNRAIRLSRIIKKKTFDISSLSKIDKEKPLKILNALFYENRKVNLVDLNVKDIESQKIVKDILYLKRDVDFILKEKGYYECYLGYPFIQGNFFDGTFFRAPLFLIPVEIEINRISQKVVLSKKEAQGVILNKTFFMAFNKYNKGFKNINLEKLEEVGDLKGNELFDWSKNIFKELNIDIIEKGFEEKKVKPLEILRKDEHPANLQGKIQFLPNAIIGEFSQLNSSLNNDYDEIIKNKFSNKISDMIFGNESETDLEERFDDEKLFDSKEEDNFFMTLPDISQEQILVKSRKGNGLVIHGPPGTGKSQVITNMIADNLLRDKKILLVCEKRAALDVVKNRLASKGINKHCLLVHDSQNDRNMIFKQIESVLSGYDISDKESNKLSTSLNEVSQKIDSKIERLRDVVDTMHVQQKFGAPLYYLYRNSIPSKKVLNFSSDTFNKFDLKKLEISLEKIQKIAKNYYKFENPNFSLYSRKRFSTNFDNIKFKEEINILIKVIYTFENIFFDKSFKSDINKIKSIDFDSLLHVLKDLREFKRLNDKKFNRYFNSNWWRLKSKYSDLIDNLDETIGRWSKIDKSLKELNDSLKYLETIFNEKKIRELKMKIIGFKSIRDEVKQIKKDSQNIDELIVFDKIFNELDNYEREICSVCYKSIPLEKDISNTWKDLILNSFYLKWIQHIESENPNLKSFSHDSYESLKKNLRTLMNKKVELIPKVINEKFMTKYHSLKWKEYDYDGRRKNYNYLKSLIHEVGKKRKRLTLRELFKQFYDDGLLEMFPCWMCSPETVSSTFLLKKDLFDIVIFDEASQCKLEKAVPSLIRAKKIIVAGDEKQLPPSTFFISRNEEDFEEIEEYNYDEKQLLDDESLLERAKTVLPGKRLIYHYRSNYPELINFSNYAFYDTYLRVIPKNSKITKRPIEYNNVGGIWDYGVNLKEAKEVVKKLKKTLKENKEGKTIGVITFNVKQKDLIEEMLDEEASKDPVFGRILDNERKRYNNEEYIGLFVKNIENVQGDERDIIIFSVSYGYDKLKKFRYMFGPLNGPYGPNRLNVAISRAREKIILFTSFEPSNLKYGGSFEGPKLLRRYLEYCKAVSEDSKDSAEKTLNSLKETEMTYEEFEEYDSDFEGEVRDALTKLGYKVKTQVGCIGYKIDLGIIHPKEKNKFIAGIECDGAGYHSSKSAKDRDIYRQKILEDNGWKILRIWSRDWWRKEEKEIKRIDRELKSLI